MKIKVLVYGFFLLLVCQASCFAQNTVVRTPFQEYYRLFVRHFKTDFLRFSATVTTRDSVSRALISNAILDIKMSRGRYTYIYDSIWVVQGHQFNLNLDQRAKVIAVTNPDNLQVFFPIPLLKNEFRISVLSSSTLIQNSSTSWTIRFVFKPDSYYSSYEIVYDPTTMQIGNQKICFRNEYGAIVETQIISWNFDRSVFDTQIFDEYVFIKNAGNTYSPMPAYSTYSVMDAVIKE